jgi:DNA-binding PadR family transcriptional regulator
VKTRFSTEFVLLGTLFQGPKHGYEIIRFLESTLESTWQVSTSQLYVLLKKLEREGYLKSSLKAQESRPSKRVFSLTAEGRKVFLEWLRCPVEHVRDLRIEFLAKLFFFLHLSLGGGKDLIKGQTRILEEIKKRFQKRRGQENDPFNRLVLGIKLRTIETWLQWLSRDAQPFMGEVY